MKAKVIETGEIVNVTPNPTWYKENGQGTDRREWDEDELEFIYSNKKEEKLDLEKVLSDLDREIKEVDLVKLGEIARHLIAVKEHIEDMRLDKEEWFVLEKIGYPEKFKVQEENKVMTQEELIKFLKNNLRIELDINECI